MSFWGMSQVGKDARGKMNELPNWYFDQMKNWWGQANDYLPQASDLQNLTTEQLKARLQQGFGSPDEIRGYGEQIMPGVSDAISRRSGRTDVLRDRAAALPQAGQVRGELDANTDEYGRGITNTSGNAQRSIDSTFDGLLGRADVTGRDIVRNIGDSYGAADTNSTGIYNESRGNVGGTYGNIGRSIDSAFTDVDAGTGAAFGEANTNLDRLNPNGEFRAARVGRSFAPALSSTAQRLRRAGIDPASLEGNAALQDVEGRRARAMDDSYADENQRFVTQKNNLVLDRLDRDTASKIRRMESATGAERERLAAELGLANRQSDNQIDLALGKGREFRGEMTRQLGTEAGLRQGQMGATLDNLYSTQDRARDYYRDRAGNIGAGRDMAFQDYGLQSNLEDRANNDDMIGFDLMNEQYDRGAQQRGRDLDVTGQAIEGLNRSGQQAWGRATQAGNMGADFGQQAQQGYGQTFGRESANAGWGKKLIGGIAGAAANYFLPGSGGIVGGMFGGGSGGGYSNPSAFRTPPFMPSRQQSKVNYNFYDPSKTQTLASGDLRIGKYAKGGTVKRPTVALIGEDGEPEHVVPQSKVIPFALRALANKGFAPNPAKLSRAMPPPPVILPPFRKRA